MISLFYQRKIVLFRSGCARTFGFAFEYECARTRKKSAALNPFVKFDIIIVIIVLV